MNRRGPATVPSSTAVFRPKSAPAASRTVVKPRISMSRMMATERKVASELGSVALKPRSGCVATTWT